MSSCAVSAASSMRMAFSSSYRAHKTRTLPSPSGISNSNNKNTATRYNSSFLRHGSLDIPSGSLNSCCRLESTCSPEVLKTPTNRFFSSGRTLPALQDATNKKRKIDMLSPALFALMLSFVAATTSPGSESSASITNTATKFGRKNGSGGGGGGGPLNPVIAANKQAEQDVQRVEEKAARTPFVVSEAAVQGARWTMEDAYSIETGGRFVGVFDGHGGSEVSTILKDRLHELYRKILSTKHWEERDDFDDPSKERIPSIASHVAALRGALELVEADVIKDDHLVYQGSTAVVVVTHIADDGRKTLLSANIGDSRAILSRKGKAIDLTRDHKPNDEREKARIRAMGEEIEWDPFGEVYRVRDLSLSRVIGDRFAKPVVSSEAEIKHFPVVDGDDEFILLASDGLFDVMESQEVVDFVHETLKSTDDVSQDYLKRMMAKNVANEALELGTSDNVCVIIVWLSEIDKA